MMDKAAEAGIEGQPRNPQADDRLGYCLYRSMIHPSLDEADIAAILEDARERNHRTGVTGCLHYEDGTFVQWIEGPWLRIFRLVDSLRDDNRHLQMTVLDQGSLSRRLFPDWDMRFSDPAAASLLDWLADWKMRSPDEAAYADRVRQFLQTIGSAGPDAGQPEGEGGLAKPGDGH